MDGFRRYTSSCVWQTVGGRKLMMDVYIWSRLGVLYDKMVYLMIYLCNARVRVDGII